MSAPLKYILQALLLAADQPLTIQKLQQLIGGDPPPTTAEISAELDDLQQDNREQAWQIQQVASGFRLQIKPQYSHWVSKLWEERPSKYSRALLETLVIIAYRQPITRGEIEAIRGVAVSSTIIRTLQEREWIKVLGHRDVPGKPAILGTTKQFLDYFNLSALTDLPPLAEIQDLERVAEGLQTPTNDENSNQTNHAEETA